MKEHSSKSRSGHQTAPHPEDSGGDPLAPAPTPAAPAPVEAETPAPTAASADIPPGPDLAALPDRLLRLQADFDNFRKRTARERIENQQKAQEQILLEWLPVIDHFEMGLAVARQHHADPAVMSGFQLVYEQMLGLLKKFDLTSLDVVGQPFDPHLHDAAAQVTSDEHPENVIISQIRRGYKLGNRVIRHAQVVVSRGPAAGPPADPDPN